MNVDDEIKRAKQAELVRKQAKKEADEKAIRAFAEHMAHLYDEEKQVEQLLETAKHMRQLQIAINRGRLFTRWSLCRIWKNIKKDTYPSYNFRGHALIGYPQNARQSMFRRMLFVGWYGADVRENFPVEQASYASYEGPLCIVDARIVTGYPEWPESISFDEAKKEHRIIVTQRDILQHRDQVPQIQQKFIHDLVWMAGPYIKRK